MIPLLWEGRRKTSLTIFKPATAYISYELDREEMDQAQESNE